MLRPYLQIRRSKGIWTHHDGGAVKPPLSDAARRFADTFSMGRIGASRGWMLTPTIWRKHEKPRKKSTRVGITRL